MSLTIIGLIGALAGILCVAVGFFLEEGNSQSVMTNVKKKRGRAIHHRRVSIHHRRAA